MEGKDNRSRTKRSKMQQYTRRTAHRQIVPPGRNGGPNSQPGDTARGVVDVADSSDDRFCGRQSWVLTRPLRDGGTVDDVRFEDELDEIECAQLRAGDFDMMAQLPSSAGGHFQFSSEKQWHVAEEGSPSVPTEASAYFTLNLELLNAGLQTIPFHKRMDYAPSMFSKDQLQSMEKTAEIAEKIYQQVLKGPEENPLQRILSGSKRNPSASSQKAPPAAKDEGPDELDELLQLTADQVVKLDINNPGEGGAPMEASTPQEVVAEKAAPGGSKEENDIQQWLDNVLEE